MIKIPPHGCGPLPMRQVYDSHRLGRSQVVEFLHHPDLPADIFAIYAKSYDYASTAWASPYVMTHLMMLMGSPDFFTGTDDSPSESHTLLATLALALSQNAEVNKLSIMDWRAYQKAKPYINQWVGSNYTDKMDGYFAALNFQD